MYRLLAQVLEMVSVLGDDPDLARRIAATTVRNKTNIHYNISCLTQTDDSSSEDSSKASEQSDDEFNWIWNPLCDCLVHVSVACIQVSNIIVSTHKVILLSITGRGCV